MSSDEGFVSKGLVLFDGLRSSLWVRSKRNHRGERPAIKGFFNTRSRKRGFMPLFFGRVAINLGVKAALSGI